jgi:hypothetical protein
LPKFIEEVHQGANILLAHFHYYIGDLELLKIDWKERHKTRLAHLSTHEVGYYYYVVELLKEKSRGKYIYTGREGGMANVRIVRAVKAAHDLNLYEDELYFVSQMFETDWKPKDGFRCPVANIDLWL